MNKEYFDFDWLSEEEKQKIWADPRVDTIEGRWAIGQELSNKYPSEMATNLARNLENLQELLRESRKDGRLL